MDTIIMFNLNNFIMCPKIDISFAICKTPKEKAANGYGKVRNGQYCYYGEYANLEEKSGIYCITNKTTGLKYIGCSSNIGHRISKHFSQLRCENHPNKKLLADYKKYGQNDFIFECLELTEENLLEKEKEYQEKIGIDNLYNLQIKDSYRSEGQRYACIHSDKSSHKTQEYRDKMRKLKQNKIGRFNINTGELLEIFENSDDVCAKYKMAKSTLLGCCNGSKKSVFGYVYRYLDNNGHIILQGKGKTRTVQDEDIV